MMHRGQKMNFTIALLSNERNTRLKTTTRFLCEEKKISDVPLRIIKQLGRKPKFALLKQCLHCAV